MSTAQTISRELQTNGYALVTEPKGLSANMVEAYAAWKQVFSNGEKYSLPRNDYAPYGYFSFRYPNGYEMKESFYYRMGSVEPPATAEKITRLIVSQFISIVGQVAASVSADLGFEGVEETDLGTLRVIHYPPFRGEEESHLMKRLAACGGMRTHAHSDLNSLTILPQATAPGLEIQDKRGEWIPMDHYPGMVLVHAGQQLEQRTGSRYSATVHRVRNPLPGEEQLPRLAMAFFVS